jgi:hypothetical protein
MVIPSHSRATPRRRNVPGVPRRNRGGEGDRAARQRRGGTPGRRVSRQIPSTDTVSPHRERGGQGGRSRFPPQGTESSSCWNALGRTGNTAAERRTAESTADPQRGHDLPAPGTQRQIQIPPQGTESSSCWVVLGRTGNTTHATPSRQLNRQIPSADTISPHRERSGRSRFRHKAPNRHRAGSCSDEPTTPHTQHQAADTTARPPTRVASTRSRRGSSPSRRRGCRTGAAPPPRAPAARCRRRCPCHRTRGACRLPRTRSR